MRLRWLVGPQQYVETYEHRVVDGVVTTAEHVHHDNRTKDDNASTNLVPLTAAEHNRLHAEERAGSGKYAPYRSAAAKAKAERAEARQAQRRAKAEEMRRLYLDERLTTLDIAERLGVHHTAVSRELRSIGVTMRAGGQRPRRDTGPRSSTRQVVTARAGLRCERCGVSVKWTAHHVHHRKPRGMGGSRGEAINLPSNLLLLCVECHGWIENNRTVGYDNGWLVHRDHDPLTTPVWLAAHGYVLLDDDGTFTAA